MTDRLTPAMLRDLADISKRHRETCVTSYGAVRQSLAGFLRDEAARREAEALPTGDEVMASVRDIVGKPDAPPPPAPGDLLKRLRSPMRHYAATADLCNEAADAIEALRAERDAALRHVKELAPTGLFNGVDIHGWKARAAAAEARVKQLEAFIDKELVPQVRAWLAQGESK